MKFKSIILVGVLSIAAFFISYKYEDLSLNFANDKGIQEVEEVEPNLILVNKENPLDSDYKPSNLVKPNIPFADSANEEERYMKSESSMAIEELFRSAEQEGIKLLGMSAYRSYDSQKNIYYNRIRSVGKKEADRYVAKPGKSEHQTGFAIDITNEDRWFVKSTEEAQWLAKNAHNYGFILRYPENKEDITGVAYEPWHIRYVGKETAKKIYEEQITFEEFIEN
ncbi:M15 family metallopeptidase [Romboutsia lituseburensis]|uniref:D-alanyl-D-alanine carboxypeptidase n=1 Tax=Romboutsia lituseburensis DSM 797 TaxID=1121325 RepID=A0A1G9TCD7_9FIRM|nr:M15 family metallopeptidase [Romboutsia lituseburensis]CEH36256.1 Serine-type D-Ala-D-Ala carboxypeptidase [Romboutsia lituseburensis]SDM45298.1 D-alanyl-D-alanine carboxypeptidase [Romboutsia lituseburensis DSM 797]